MEQGNYKSGGINPDSFFTISFIVPFQNTSYFQNNLLVSSYTITSGWSGGTCQEIINSRTISSVNVSTEGIGAGGTWYGAYWAACGYANPPTASDWAENLSTSPYKRYIKY